MTHTITVIRTDELGVMDTWTTTGPGTAQDAHDALAARWKAAGFNYDRDRAAMSLIRQHVEPFPHTETVTHADTTTEETP